MYPQLTYGAWYLVLRMIDLTCFQWHGLRPTCWQRKLVKHRFRAPHGGEFTPFGTDKERAALKKSQASFRPQTGPAQNVAWPSPMMRAQPPRNC